MGFGRPNPDLGSGVAGIGGGEKAFNRKGRRGTAKDAKETSEADAQGKLQLARGVGAGGSPEIGRHLVVSGEVVDSKLFSAVVEGGGVAR